MIGYGMSEDDLEDEDNKKYKVSIKVNKNILPFIKEGDTITIKYNKEAEVITIKEIKN